MILKMALGYMVITVVVGILYVLSTKLYFLIRKKWSYEWNAHEFSLALCSMLLILLLWRFYPDMFPVVNKKVLWRWEIFVLMVIASIPAAVLAVRAYPHPPSSRSFKVSLVTGMSMEIPQRLLVQNLFVLFGMTPILIGSLTLAVVLTAIIWAQFIMLQEIILKKPLTFRVILESIASIWFSIWVGLLYTMTGNIVVAMLAHGIEKSVVFALRYKRMLMLKEVK